MNDNKVTGPVVPTPPSELEPQVRFLINHNTAELLTNEYLFRMDPCKLHICQLKKLCETPPKSWYVAGIKSLSP
jgi:hypothetical protein